jgi:PAS domain S-box-containing protein
MAISSGAPEPAQGTAVRVLLVEDVIDDAELVLRALRNDGFSLTSARVEDRAALEASIRTEPWDVVISDHSLPRLDATEALAIVRQASAELPFIVVSGTVSEEMAVGVMRAGAQDYISKGNLVRLGPAVRRELREAANRRARRQAEVARQRAQASLASLTDNFPDLVLVFRAGRIVYVNAALCRTLGYDSPDALVGQSPCVLVRPEDEALVLQRMNEAMLGRIDQAERKLVRRDGDLVSVEVAAQPLEFEGEPAVVCVARDLTDRQKLASDLAASNARFRTLLRAMQDVVFSVDTSLRYTSMYGISTEGGPPAASVHGKRAQDLMMPAEAAVHEVAYTRAFRGENVVFEWSHDARGETRHYQTAVSPLRDASGAIHELVGVTRDVTKNRLLQDELLLSERLATVGSLAAGLAHEINNPLGALLLNLELLVEAAPSPVDEALTDAWDAAKRVRDIVHDVKMFARAADERHGTVDMRTLLDSTIRLAMSEIKHRGRVTKAYAVEPCIAQGNESRLGQVLLNLVVNAAQALPDGQYAKNEIRLAVRREGESVVVEIADNGSGMPPEVVARLFTPFFTTKAPGVGTGIGLSISKRIIDAVGGTISVESEVGRGTTFRVRLPAAPV